VESIAKVVAVLGGFDIWVVCIEEKGVSGVFAFVGMEIY
jgi:hypothetical protein